MEFYKRIPDENIISDRILKWIIDIMVVMAIAIFISRYLFSEENVIGNSMSGMLNSEEKVFVDSISYEFFKPDRFDVIKFHVQSDQGVKESYIKRIIGLPGETVQIKEGRVYINDKELDYQKKKERIVNAGLAAKPVTLGKNEYFVMGDNWNSSEDSRFTSIGTVETDNIEGKVWLRAAPFARIGLVRKPN